MIGPLLIKELLERNQPVIACVVGSEESRITTDNTIKTLQSLDAISRKVDKPIPITYVHNSPENSREKNDNQIRTAITSLSVLTSRENKELDTKDVANFVKYDEVSSVKQGIAFMYISSSIDEAKSIQYPIAIASLMAKAGELPYELEPEYSCVGYPIHDVLKNTDLHFVISQANVASTFNKLKDRLSKYDENASAKPQSVTVLGKDIQADDDGMVF